MWAAAGGHAGVVKLLLSNGADASMQKHDGKSAVNIAAFKKHRQVTARQTFSIFLIAVHVRKGKVIGKYSR